MSRKKKNRGVRPVRSKTSQQTIEVTKRLNIGKIPLFVQLAHRALEKGSTAGEDRFDGMAFTVPKDIMALSVNDPGLLDAIDQVEFIYKRS